jgi:hypothetical protein
MEEILHLKSGIKFKNFSRFDLVSNILRLKREFESWNNPIASLVLSESKKGNVVDVGVYIGTFSIPLAKVFSNINIHAFNRQMKNSLAMIGDYSLKFTAVILAERLV